MGAGQPPAPPSAARDAALIEAAALGQTAIVGELLDRGAAVDARDGTGRTALIAAAYGNHIDTALVLIRAGSDVNTQMTHSKAPI
jgi:ankyrin repeat protein